MDSVARSAKKDNPREKASILSVVAFLFTFDLFKKSRVKDLDEDDVYNIIPFLGSKKLGDALEDRWVEQQKKQGRPSLIRALTACFGKRYFVLGLIQLVVKISLILIQPRALANVVAYFDPKKGRPISRNDLYQNAALVVGLNLLSTIYNHNYQQFVTEVGIKVRTAIVALIYRKALKLGPDSLSDISTGKIITLMTKDVFAFEKVLTFVNDMLIGLVQTAIVTYLIYTRIGFSVVAGVGFFLVIIPLQVYVGKKASAMRIRSARKTDERLQLTTETLNAIKIIKMYSWEKFFETKIHDVRKQELKYLAPVYYMKCIVMIIGTLALNISFFLLLVSYIWTGHYATAETVYFIQSCFFSLKSYITASIPIGIAQCSEVYASTKRLREFLYTEELQKRPSTTTQPRIYMSHVSAKVADTEVLKDVSLLIEKGLFLIVGSLGSGKSSLLKTIMGDYTLSQGQMSVEGKISYASEEPWLFPSTIRQNILFGQEYDENRYQQVLRVCALNLDLSKFQHGDRTIVGDKGVNLSKGQQARINLARAVYKDSDIYLLDDCLSHLDAKVNLYVYTNCIMGFLKDKIVVLVTNNLNHIKMVYGNNTLFVEDGKTLSLQQQQETLDKRITYYMDDVDYNYFEDEKADIDESYVVDASDEKAALLREENETKDVYHETKRTGKVALSAYLRYYRFAGGCLVFLLFLTIFTLSQIALSAAEKLLSKWVIIEASLSDLSTKSNATMSSDLVTQRNQYLYIYCTLIAGGVLLVFSRTYFTFFLAVKASKNLHKAMNSSVLNSFMNFFDSHRIGNIINRFSKDLNTTDEILPLVVYEVTRNTLMVIGILVLIASVNITFLIPSAFLLILLYFIRKIYIPVGRSIKRLEASTRSPMIGYLNATLEGLSTVRAYEKQAHLIDEFDRHQDHYTSAYYMMICTTRAFGFCLDLVCTAYIASVVLQFVIGGSGSGAGDVGLAITQAMGLTGLLQWGIRQYSELENNMTAVERVLEYTDIETENREKGRRKENWPNRGDIEYRGLSLTYSTTRQMVLKDISFVIRSKEKVGIVGRTGAGKSSIISSLFRLYETEGRIFVDGLDTKTVALEFLRSNIAIIPQDPILFSGTIRSNIDPTGKYSDEAIWKAIEQLNIKRLFPNLQEKIRENGSNYSSGQRQLICLARALVSESRIIVLDEATANMDPETCALLQRTMKENFAGCTVLTIAHRLNTVTDSDRVMVVDQGRIVEFDSPSVLMEDKNGVFYNMVKTSGLPEL
uniref:Putative ABCC protein n=1 Tax=Chrysomela populi TaxID=154003 RepID=A0A0U9HY04_CHRPP